jgi:hypothetical protein
LPHALDNRAPDELAHGDALSRGGTLYLISEATRCCGCNPVGILTTTVTEG